MAKSKEREEKNCLNCGTTVQGLYCHSCGQKNVQPRRPLWEIPWAFIEDMINVDGKFLPSVKQLIFKPGYLSKAYINGRRHSFNDPVRIYLVTSFVFFIVSGFVFNDLKRELDQSLSKADLQTLQIDSTENGNFNFSKNTNASLTYSTDSLNMKDTTALRTRALQASEKVKALMDETKSSLPYLFWVSLPLFALVLKLLYIRRKMFFWDHLIFSLHIYSFSFLLICVSFGLFQIIRWIFGPGIAEKADGILILVTLLLLGIYFFAALKHFYGQGYFKTFLKFTLLNGLFGGLLLLEIVLFIILIVRTTNISPP